VASSRLLLNVFVEVSTKGFGAERHEHRTSTEVYGFEYQARHSTKLPSSAGGFIEPDGCGQRCAARKEETPRSLIAGSLLTRLLGRARGGSGRGVRVPSTLHQQTDKAPANTSFEPEHCNRCNAHLRRIQEREMRLLRFQFRSSVARLRPPPTRAIRKSFPDLCLGRRK
jgi:hypothetical protein